MGIIGSDYNLWKIAWETCERQRMVGITRGQRHVPKSKKQEIKNK